MNANPGIPLNIYVNAKFLTKPITGLERYALELSLATQNYQNDLIFLSPRKNFSDTHYDLSQLNIFPVGSSKNYFWEQIELPLYLLKNKKPLLVNMTNTAPVIYRNQVTVIHDLAFMHNPDWYSRKAWLFFSWIVKQSAKASKHIITVSNFSKSEIQKYLHIPSERITVIPEGISSTILSLSENEYPNAWGNYILAVATLEPRKNLVNLIKAFLKAGVDDYKLLIVGSSNSTVFNNPELDEFRKNNCIIFLGYVNDLILTGLYKNAKLFTYISHYEGFGIPPLEALVSGCPVLASNVSSIPEILGEFAEYCNPCDVDDISGKIKKMIQMGRRVSKEEIEKISRKYDWEKSALLFLQTIRKIYSGDGRIK